MSDNSITTVVQATTMLEVIEQKKQAYIPLLRELVVNGRKLSDDQIIGRAVFAACEGLDPLSEVHTLVDKEGRTMAHTMAINGLRRKNQEQVGVGQEITVSFLEMTEPELAKCVGAAIGYKCYLRDGQAYTAWQKRLLEVGKALREAMGQAISFAEIIQVCGPAPVTEGIGLFYKSEFSPDWKDKSYNPIERTKKRAELNARHHRFGTHAPVYDGENGTEVIEAPYRDALPTPAIAPALEAAIQLEPVRLEKPKKSQEQLMAELGFAPKTRQELAPLPVANTETLAAIIESDETLKEMFPSQPMSLDEAQDRTNQGRRYGDLSNEELHKIADVSAKRAGLGYNDNLLAAQLILEARAQALAEADADAEQLSLITG